jgi:hypothetical protein
MAEIPFKVPGTQRGRVQLGQAQVRLELAPELEQVRTCYIGGPGWEIHPDMDSDELKAADRVTVVAHLGWDEAHTALVPLLYDVTYWRVKGKGAADGG